MTIFVLAVCCVVASARPSKDKDCGVQLVLPGILKPELVATAVVPPVDLAPALARGLRLAQFETPELLADLTIGLPEGFALHGGSVVELKRAVIEGKFRGASPSARDMDKIIPLVADDELEAVAASRFFSVLTSADIAADDGDSALIEVPKALAKTSAVTSRILGLKRSKNEKFDALAPVFDHLTVKGGPYSTLRSAGQHPTTDLEMRKLIEDYLKVYRDPSRWTLTNAGLREGVLFVFKSSALRGKIEMEDPREIGTILAMTPNQGVSLQDLWAIIPLSKYDRTDLIDALPAYDEVFSPKRASSLRAR